MSKEVVTGADMAARIVNELTQRGRLSHADALEVDHDRRVVANVLGACLREAFRTSMSAGPIAATLDEIERAPSRRNLDTEADRAFWDGVDRTAAEVATWPEAKRHPANCGSTRALDEPFADPDTERPE